MRTHEVPQRLGPMEVGGGTDRYPLWGRSGGYSLVTEQNACTVGYRFRVSAGRTAVTQVTVSSPWDSCPSVRSCTTIQPVMHSLSAANVPTIRNVPTSPTPTVGQSPTTDGQSPAVAR